MMSKYSVAPGGMSGAEPFIPYPILGGTTSFRLPPTRIPLTPLSQPLMTSPAPSTNWKDFAESNVYPESSCDQMTTVTRKR